MAADLKRFKQLIDPEFYRQLAPDLTISDQSLLSVNDPYPVPDEIIADADAQLLRDGYYNTPPIVPEVDCQIAVDAIRRIVDAGLPAVFAIMYDEVWKILSGARRLYTGLLGPNYRYAPASWVFHVDGKSEKSGFAAHRDQPAKAQLLCEDGRPNQVVYWFALSPVSYDNSCIYVLPISDDPDYPDNRQNCDISEFTLPAIRPLPAPTGAIMGWQGGLLHWSGPRLSEHLPARCSMVLIAHLMDDVTCGSIPQISPDQVLTFDDRLSYVARSMFYYGFEYEAHPDLHYFARAYAGLFDLAGRRKVAAALNGGQSSS